MESPMLNGARREDEGFSLVELMTVVAIIGILVATAVASFNVSISRSRRIACLQNQRLLDSGIMQYQVDHAGLLPTDLIDVKPYVKWSGTGYGTCASDSSLALTYDPVTGFVGCTNHPR
jgi:prepilin-type N-terminal cleavage/methylation domain-containing protein